VSHRMEANETIGTTTALQSTYPTFVDIWFEPLYFVESLDWILWPLACSFEHIESVVLQEH
jgi:hypothetical protein